MNLLLLCALIAMDWQGRHMWERQESLQNLDVTIPWIAIIIRYR